MVQVSTLCNPADIGAKNLPRARHLMLLFMLGVVDGGHVIGESIDLDQKQHEFNKRSFRSIQSVFS